MRIILNYTFFGKVCHHEYLHPARALARMQILIDNHVPFEVTYVVA